MDVRLSDRGRRFALCAGLAMVTALGGCASLQGAPPSPFNEPVAKSLELTGDEIKQLAATQDTTERNQLLRRLVSYIDVRYLGFVGQVMSQTRHQGAMFDLLDLSADVASGLTGSVAAKTNYAAFGALLTGTDSVIDSQYLFNQTLPALISAMDEQRAVVATRIRSSMSLSITDYPGPAALGDAIQYYRVGTLAAGVVHLQQGAASRAEKEQQELRTVPIPTDAQVAAAITRADALATFVNDDANVDEVRVALIKVGAKNISQSSSADDVRDAAFAYYREKGPRGEADTFLEALKSSGFVDPGDQ